MGRNSVDASGCSNDRHKPLRDGAILAGVDGTLAKDPNTGVWLFTPNVTVADDGGSSGELRRSMGVLPPGDIRHCLTALADDETLMGQLFQYRFAAGNGLSGHSLGNLLITALTDITGSFEEAVAESGQVLAVRGKVLPATLHDVRLVADIQLLDESVEVTVKGESKIPKAAGRIRRVWLEPNEPQAYPEAVRAILDAAKNPNLP